MRERERELEREREIKRGRESERERERETEREERVTIATHVATEPCLKPLRSVTTPHLPDPYWCRCCWTPNCQKRTESPIGQETKRWQGMAVKSLSDTVENNID